jgi:hypothetical protein
MPAVVSSAAEQRHRVNGFQRRLVQGLRASLTPSFLAGHV